MEINPQTSQKIKIVSKYKFDIRFVLNLYGIFTVIALLLSIFTVQVSVNENMELFIDRNLMMEPKKIKEFVLFIFGSSLVYFPTVNLYYKKKGNESFH